MGNIFTQKVVGIWNKPTRKLSNQIVITMFKGHLVSHVDRNENRDIGPQRQVQIDILVGLDQRACFHAL